MYIGVSGVGVYKYFSLKNLSVTAGIG